MKKTIRIKNKMGQALNINLWSTPDQSELVGRMLGPKTAVVVEPWMLSPDVAGKAKAGYLEIVK